MLIHNFAKNISRELMRTRNFVNNLKLRIGPNETKDLTEELSDKKIGRNNPCPCGSGKKYKQCHGK